MRFASSDENCLAVVTGGGHVAFWELNLQAQGVSKVSFTAPEANQIGIAAKTHKFGGCSVIL